MAELKTQPTDVDPREFLAGVTPKRRQADGEELLEMMTDITGADPVMWGPSIIGFGHTHLQYRSGRELDWFVIGFSPRKASLSLYLNNDYQSDTDLMRRLGKHRTGAGCLYINKLDDVDRSVLRELLEKSVAVVDNPPSD
jgi:hypothetical protein